MLKSKQLLSTGLLFGTLFFTGCFNSNHSDKIKKMFEKQNSKTKTYQTQKPKESKEPKKKNIPVQRQVLQKENHKQILNLEQKIQTLNHELRTKTKDYQNLKTQFNSLISLNEDQTEFEVEKKEFISKKLIDQYLNGLKKSSIYRIGRLGQNHEFNVKLRLNEFLKNGEKKYYLITNGTKGKHRNKKFGIYTSHDFRIQRLEQTDTHSLIKLIHSLEFGVLNHLSWKKKNPKTIFSKKEWTRNELVNSMSYEKEYTLEGKKKTNSLNYQYNITQESQPELKTIDSFSFRQILNNSHTQLLAYFLSRDTNLQQKLKSKTHMKKKEIQSKSKQISQFTLNGELNDYFGMLAKLETMSQEFNCTFETNPNSPNYNNSFDDFLFQNNLENPKLFYINDENQCTFQYRPELIKKPIFIIINENGESSNSITKQLKFNSNDTVYVASEKRVNARVGAALYKAK